MGLPKLRSIFDAFLVPTCLHFASQNPPKTLQKPTPRGTKILIDFCIAFLSFLAPFWDPSWGHVGHFFGPELGARNGGRVVFVGSMFFFEFLAVLAPSWPHLGSILAPLGPTWPRFWRFWGPFWHRFGAMLGPLGATSWHWKGWWGYAKRKELLYNSDNNPWKPFALTYFCSISVQLHHWIWWKLFDRQW